MNCQDISLALDDRDIGALSEAQRREFDAHVASCPECAEDWELHQRMAATRTPAMPAGLPAQARTLVAAHRAGGSHRGPNRFVLLGVVLAVAAAAAVLVAGLTPAPQPVVAKAVAVPDSVAAADALIGDAVLPSAEEKIVSDAADAQSAPKAVPAAVKPFIVQVLPLENKVTDVVGRNAAVLMYQAFLKRMRAVPGLTLLDMDAGSASDTPPGYRIKVIGERWGEQFGFNIEAETLLPDGTTRSGFYFGGSGEPLANCTSALPMDADSSTCTDPEGLAINMLGNLRKMVFPPDPTLRRQLQARLNNRSLDAQQRIQTLYEVAMFGGVNLGRFGMDTAQLEALRDPVVVRGAVEIATTAADPLQRAAAWNTMRGVDNTTMVKPLLAALRQDPAHEVRVAALGTLAAGFDKDPQARAALETIARQEADPMVHALAQRAVGDAGGDAAWRQYMLASLQDTSRPATERVEALFYQMNLPMSAAFGAGSRASDEQSLSLLLDADSITALVAVLPALGGESTYMQSSLSTLMNQLGGMEHPAITDMLLAAAQGSPTALPPQTAIYALGQLPSRRDDPRVRAALTKIRNDDPNPELRKAAGEALERVPVAIPVTDKPRLGLSFNTVKAGDGAPPELVGKLLILAIGAGPGQRAGMKVGDAVLEINGVPLVTPVEAIKVMDTLPRGVDIDVLIERAGEKQTLKVRF